MLVCALHDLWPRQRSGYNAIPCRQPKTGASNPAPDTIGLSQQAKWGNRSCYRSTKAKTRRSLSGTQASSRTPPRGLSSLATCLGTISPAQRVAYAHGEMSQFKYSKLHEVGRYPICRVGSRLRERYKSTILSCSHGFFIRFRFGLPSLKAISVVAKMAPVLSFIVGSLLAMQAFAEPFEKLFEVPEGELYISLSFD